MSIHRNFIAGAWVEGDVVTRNINPSDTRDFVGEYARASRLQAESAIAATSAAQPLWAAGSPQQRFEVLERIGQEILSRRAELSELLALGPCSELVNSTRCGMEVEIAREAVGVVCIITPRNFPIAIPTWKIAPAPAYGNMGRPRSPSGGEHFDKIDGRRGLYLQPTLIVETSNAMRINREEIFGRLPVSSGFAT